MAFATELTISTGNKVSLNYQSQEVSVTLTYQLEREDTDVLAVVCAKTGELAQAHRTAWQTLRDAKVVAAPQEQAEEQSKEQASAETIELAEAAVTLTPESVLATEEPPPTPSPPITPGQVSALHLLLNQCGWNDNRRQVYLREHGAGENIDDLTAPQATQWLLDLQRVLRARAQQQRLKTPLNGSEKSL